MKISASALLLTAAFAATSAFADAANTLITFSTPGPDKYADGATVADGELYALVWTKGEDFAGFTTAGEAVNSEQKVFFKAALAKGGRCPLTLFQIDSAVAPKEGVYSVYLLDTRGSKEQTIVTGSALAKTYAKEGGLGGTTAVTDDKTVDSVTGEAVALKSSTAGIAHDPSVVSPVITGFKVGDADVKITVANVFPGFAYDVKGGVAPDKQEVVASEITAKEDNTIELTVGKDKAQFFSIKAR